MRSAQTLVLIVLAGCGGSDSYGEPTDTDYYGYSGSNTGAGDYGDDDTTGTTTLGEPEVEDDFLALRPAQTNQYVFIANPNRNTATRIDLLTQEVRTTEVGVDPQLVQTTPDFQSAAVFNRGDDTISLLDASTMDQQVVAIRPNMNQMAISPDSRWVALWHDADAERADDPVEPGAQSFNEASFVDLSTGTHHAMAVGFNPRSITYTADSRTAVVVSDNSVALVDLDQPVLLPELLVISDDLAPPKAEELVLAPDGSYGFLRQFGATELLVLDLPGRGIDRVPVGENPTDLDLSPDGSKAVALSRNAMQLWIYDVADPFATPQIIDLPVDPPGGFGQLVFDPRGEQAILFTNATLTDRYAVWDLATDSITVRKLAKPVQSMALTPTGESMMVFHTLEDALDVEPTSPFIGEWALTLVDLTDFRTNPLLLPAEPTGFANSLNGDFGYFIMKGERYLEVMHYDTLLYDQVDLPSDPVWVGVLPDTDPADGDEPPAWVSQDHELGRLTFYDADDGTAETITGFELNAEVE